MPSWNLKAFSYQLSAISFQRLRFGLPLTAEAFQDKKQGLQFRLPRASGDQRGIRAHFTGRSAQNILGRCVGLGDSFDVQIASTPYYHDGVIAVKDVRVESINKDGVYIRMVRAALAYSLGAEFQYRVMDDAKKMLEAPRDPLPISQELRSFRVSEIRVTGDALVLTLDFTLAVK